MLATNVKCTIFVQLVAIINRSVWAQTTSDQSLSALQNKTCTTQNQTLYAELGWPYRLKCQPFVEYQEEEQQCIIFNGTNHQMLYNETSTYYDFFDGLYISEITEYITSFQVAVISEISPCTLYQITLNHTSLSQNNCEYDSNSLLSRPHRLGKGYSFSCEDASADVPIHYDEGNLRHFQARWLHNCSTALPSGVVEYRDSDGIQPTLRFLNLSVEQLGVYTCAITYKNKTRFYVRNKICITLQEIATQSPTVTCSTPEVFARPDQRQNITVKCVASFGVGIIRSWTFTSTWLKEGSEKFKCVNLSPNTIKQKDRYSCVYFIDNPYNNECIEDRNVVLQRNNTPATVTLQLTLSDVREEDLGMYKIMIRTPRKENATDGFELKYESADTLNRNVLIIGLCIGLSAFVCLLLGMLYGLSTYIAVYVKRWFSAYDADDKKHDVILSYHYSTADDNHAKQQARSVVQFVRRQLDSFQLKVYDEHIDGKLGERVKEVMAAMENSHRFLIILTYEYIKDDWKLFQLQQSFKAMIESKYSLVFVLVPGIQEFLKQHSRSDETCKMIRKAIQMNHSIEWSDHGVLPEKRFMLRLEYAMPKLKRSRRSDGDENGNITNV